MEEFIQDFIQMFLHIDKYLDTIVTQYGLLTYVILFLIVFCETGLVVTPFLPGDSLLFAAGAISTRGDLNVHLIVLLLFIAAVLGDAVNYYIGSKIGDKAFSNPDSKIFRKSYYDKTHAFYEKYGAKTIIIARFVPIVRTFAPFLAGAGKMTYSKFAFYNVTGAALWVVSLTYLGYIFGELPIVKNNFSLVIMGIIILSVMPIVVEIIKARFARASS